MRQDGRASASLAVPDPQSELRALLTAISDVVLVIDGNGRYLKIAQSRPDLLVRPAAELLGRTFHEVLPPEVADRFLFLVRGVLRHRRTARIEYRMDVVEGRSHWFDASVTPVTGNTVLWLARDITGRKLAEEMGGRFTEVLEATPELIEIGDAEGNGVYRNPAALRLLGIPESDRDSPFQLFAASRRPEWAQQQMTEQAIPTALRERVWSGGSVLLTRTGRQVPVWEVLIAHKDAQDRVRQFTVVARDLTDREQLQAQLRQAQKLEAVGKLAGGVAHDFNNMLLVISGFATLLEAEVAENDEARRYIAEIRNAVERSSGLTRQLLAFSRKQILRFEVVDPGEVLRNLEEMLRRLIGEDVALEMELAPDLHPVYVDRGQIEQVIVNLAVNSRDAMPRGGRLTISARNRSVDTSREAEFPVPVAPGSYVELTVSDTGRGMTEETLEHVFEPFFTTKEVGEGTGLGLSTAYGVIKQSRGFIWATSDVGMGTTFRILLPEARDRDLSAPRSPAEGPVLGGKETLLVVEDDGSVRELLGELLRRAGYEVIVAASGAQALESMPPEQRLDLAILDVVMPQMNGPEIAARLRMNRPELKVLYMSGHTDDRVVRHGVMHHQVSYLEKPVSPDELLRKVREVLES